jgi:hypothetical protein
MDEHDIDNLLIAQRPAGRGAPAGFTASVMGRIHQAPSGPTETQRQHSHHRSAIALAAALAVAGVLGLLSLRSLQSSTVPLSEDNFVAMLPAELNPLGSEWVAIQDDLDATGRFLATVLPIDPFSFNSNSSRGDIQR